MQWFGFTGSSTTTTTGPTSTPTTTTSAATTTTTGSSPGADHWAQCGGIGWTGATTCVSPYTCQEINDYYSQCL
ncbi:fungal cellulose binding domain-containing protein [Xylariaceae sp. FL1651]|nr:fungal cellulose binding domain-containing protein [Xylariaceae sp. FL1651]